MRRRIGGVLGAALGVVLVLCSGSPQAGNGDGDGGGDAIPCTMVFGQRRDLTIEGGRFWDGVNDRFHSQVAATLESAGRRVVRVAGPPGAIDPGQLAEKLLRKALELGCPTIVETTVFEDQEAGTLVIRLRASPILPMVDARAGITGFRIGPQIYVSQRDLPLSQASLDRLNPAALGAEMASEYAHHNER